MAGDGAILELGDHLLEYVNGLEPSLPDDLLLDPFGLLAGAVLISYRGGRSRKLYASGGSRSANPLRLSVAAIPKTNWMSPARPSDRGGCTE